MPELICARCTHPNHESSNYCSSCGFDLHRSLEEETTEIQVVDLSDAPDDAGSMQGGASFVVKRGHKAGTRYAIDGAVTTIGRHPESDIFLDDVTVSRRHAEVRRDGERITIDDVGSLNGTYLNRSRIESTGLRSGDEVQVGKFKLVFLTEDA